MYTWPLHDELFLSEVPTSILWFTANMAACLLHTIKECVNVMNMPLWSL
jgi:hypothetical protein